MIIKFNDFKYLLKYFAMKNAMFDFLVNEKN